MSTLTLTTEEITENPFITAEGTAAFYRLMSLKVMHKPMEQIGGIDCRHICVSQDIQDSWYEQTHLTKQELTMSLALYGPKIDSSLPYGTVSWDDKCFS